MTGWVDWRTVITCINVLDYQAAKLCRGCHGPLTGRQAAYCSEPCQLAFDREHFWNMARGEAIRRNARVHGGKPSCVRCGIQESMDVVLEVNHIEPVRGGPRNGTCLNHQENLELLCHPCHVLATEEQFRPEKAELRRIQVAML